MEINVSAGSYSGPLEVLLDLIKKNNIDIFDIPIADITNQFLLTIDKMKQQNLEVSGDFLVMATSLLRIKSQMLLPEMVDNDDEAVDPRDEIVGQLLNYKAIREVTELLKDKEAERAKQFHKEPSELFDLNQNNLIKDQSLTVNALTDFFEDMLKNNIISVNPKIIQSDSYTVSEQMELIIDKVRLNKEFMLSELFVTEHITINLVVTTFMALLELIKDQKINYEQIELFSDIKIKGV